MRQRDQIYRHFSSHLDYELKCLYRNQFDEWLFYHIGRNIGNTVKYDLINLQELLGK
jgi:hypothetical protein